MEAVAQTINMLIIDKKTMRLKDAGLPAAVIENTPKYLRRSKVPIVKAKVGPKIMTLMCDAQVFPLIPVKKEVKAVVSGIYIKGCAVLWRRLRRRKASSQDLKRISKEVQKEV